LDRVAQWEEAIREAARSRRPFSIRGGGTKAFYGGTPRGEPLDTSSYLGIVEYEPTELVMTMRCGTPLAEVEKALKERGQMLAFEPPHFGASSTLGGAVAAGLSGPRRPYAGAVRDFVLGVRMLDGKGNDLRFGGKVMKNVAGYDVSRLMCGALGTLGVILEVSIKVLPLPVAEITVQREQTQADAIALMNDWAGKPLPITATCHYGNALYVRLAGAAAAVRAAREKIGGEEVADGSAFWRAVRDQTLDFFQELEPLWRLSVKTTTPPLNLAGPQLIEWGGGLRWLRTRADAGSVRHAAAFGGGHATLFRGGDRAAGAFHPLTPALEQLHRRLKEKFDPAGIFNPGRLYPWM
jgi:glycolate oxidase FAD binding subunit